MRWKIKYLCISFFLLGILSLSWEGSYSSWFRSWTFTAAAHAAQPQQKFSENPTAAESSSSTPEIKKIALTPQEKSWLAQYKDIRWEIDPPVILTRKDALLIKGGQDIEKGKAAVVNIH